MKGLLTEEQQGWINDEPTSDEHRGISHSGITMHINPDRIWQLRPAVADLLHRHEVLKIQGFVPRISLDSAPWEITIRNVVGKAKGWLIKQGIDRSRIKSEYRSPKTTILAQAASGPGPLLTWQECAVTGPTRQVAPLRVSP